MTSSVNANLNDAIPPAEILYRLFNTALPDRPGAIERTVATTARDGVAPAICAPGDLLMVAMAALNAAIKSKMLRCDCGMPGCDMADKTAAALVDGLQHLIALTAPVGVVGGFSDKGTVERVPPRSERN